MLKAVSSMPPSHRSAQGAQINKHRKQFEDKISQAKALLEQRMVAEKLKSGRKDTSLPTSKHHPSSIHPLTLITRRVVSILSKYSFDVAVGPEIETSYYNFTALNTPEHHPARTMQDTFYLHQDYLLRSHTSPVQIRIMEHQPPPLRVISPGRVFRADTLDATHSPCFYQCEGLVIDETSTIQDLVQLLSCFLNEFFGEDLPIRFRSSYFPFTEPSLECDIYFKGSWLEVLGCGMVHPSVLEHASIDATRYQGFAFGMGIDRLAMLYYGIDDIRYLYDGDLSFLQQFRGFEGVQC